MAMIISTPQYKVAIHMCGAHPLGEQRTKENFHAVEAITKLPCNKLTTTCLERPEGGLGVVVRSCFAEKKLELSVHWLL